MKRKTGGCVILYHPEAEVVSNIRSYCSFVEILFVIDNSQMQDLALTEQIRMISGKIEYRWMGGNKGLSAGLNLGCRLAMQQQCDWLLTMDQDSHFEGSELADLIAGIDSVEQRFGETGILSPYHLVSKDFDTRAAERYTAERFVMTSGNLLNLGAATRIGPFEEKLFIDCVDMDYCLRLRKAGFAVIQDNSVQLRHSLGNFQKGKIAALAIGYSNHNPVRRYYITRNRSYVLRKYFRFDPKFSLLVLRSMIGDTVRVLFFEKEKLSKFRAMFTGVWHSLTGHYGKYDPGKGKEGGAKA